MNKTCKKCNSAFEITPDDQSFYSKIDVPTPTLCPECRFKRRVIFRNEKTYYKRTCDLCSKNIIAVYPQDFKTPVYCVKCWWSDKWDPGEYGRDYDPSRSFIDQFKEVFDAVPVIAMQNDDGVASVNCPYTYDFAFSKNCYMCLCGWYCENSMYIHTVSNTKDTIDGLDAVNDDLCYQIVSVTDSYACSFVQDCVNCTDCFFGYDLRGCTDCIMSVGLRNKSYCIRNKQYTKEEYFKIKESMQLDRRDRIEEYKKEFQELILQYPRKYARMINSVDCTGYSIRNGKKSQNVFYAYDIEDSKFVVICDDVQQSYDCNNTGKNILNYESITPDNSANCISTIYCWKCTFAEYSNNCHSSNNIMGCSGLKKADYAILNKKYTKEEYIELRKRIIEDMRTRGEWGEFLPASMSHFAYNESAVWDWFKLSKDEAIAQGYAWKDEDKKNYKMTMSVDAIPQTIAETPDDITKEIIACRHAGACDEKCTGAFIVTSQEVQLYRRMNIPIPEYCPNCRFYQRLEKRNPPRLYHRQCMKEGCPNEFETSYEPSRPEIIYCEQCYQAEII